MSPIAEATANTEDVFDQLQENGWYLPAPGTHDGIYVTELGHGPAVVVLHGGPGGDFSYLVDAVRPLANRYRFILFDQRGSLLSPVPEEKLKSLSLAQLVDDLEALRNALGEPKLVLLGHSEGTLLALSYYQKFPQRVSRLILTGAFPPATDPGMTLDDLWKPVTARLKALQGRPEVARLMQEAGIPDDGRPDALSPRLRWQRTKLVDWASINVCRLKNWRTWKGGGVYYNTAVSQAIGNSDPEQYDFVSTLRQSPVPVEVIQGDQDFVDPGASRWQAISHSLPVVHVSVIKQACHYSWIDDSHAFTADLSSALRGLAAGTR
ncbi:alpha/beta fold hydrolase [Dyella choica]|uniref:alpha/beta fold hydrolase n=1 Tax=Dyella choica TaxID=1927959 RepID=UPI00131504E3|nr:alpha/beta hydrolase [Dyella choica]